MNSVNGEYLCWLFIAVSVEDALYLAVNVNADVNTTYRRGTAARMLPVALLWARMPLL